MTTRRALAAGVALAMLGILPLWVPLAGRAMAGGLVDNDDAMRLVEVRDWLGGQAWYDLVQHRVDPPLGLWSHWSRLIDVPLAVGIELFGLAADPLRAERLTAVLWPTLLWLAFVAAALALALRLARPGAVALGGLLCGPNVPLVFQFVPGRVDHHGVQLVLTAVVAAGVAIGIEERRALPAAWAGLASAVMLAVGLETLPLSAVAAGALGLAWVVERGRGPAAAGFGGALAGAAPLLALATVAPARWGVGACDAISPPWLWLAAGGGLALVGFAALPDGIAGRGAVRLVIAVVAGVILVGGFAAGWPACLGGPYGGVDPLVREAWLGTVGEALPIGRMAAKSPGTFGFFVIFPAIGALGLAHAAYVQRRPLPFALLAFLGAASAVMTWQMRGAPFAAAFGLFGWVWWLDRALAARLPVARAAGALAVLALGLPVGWYVVLADLGRGSAEPPVAAACKDPATYADLASRPPGLVLAPIEIGPRLLVATPHAVLGVPYHRNDHGNAQVVRAFLASGPDARRFVTERGVRYVATCAGAGSFSYEPPAGSLADLLHRGDAPDWLVPLPGDGPLRVWEVR